MGHIPNPAGGLHRVRRLFTVPARRVLTAARRRPGGSRPRERDRRGR